MFNRNNKMGAGYIYFNGSSYVTTPGVAGQQGPAGVPGAGLEADSIALLRTTTIPSYNEHIFVKGYYSPGDGGGGFFYWNSSSAASDDGGLTIASSLQNSGRWIRIVSTSIDIRWFGASTSGTEAANSTAIQNAINAATNGLTVYVPLGTFNCKNLTLLTNIKFQGDALGKSILQSQTGSIFNLTYGLDNNVFDYISLTANSGDCFTAYPNTVILYSQFKNGIYNTGSSAGHVFNFNATPSSGYGYEISFCHWDHLQINLGNQNSCFIAMNQPSQTYATYYSDNFMTYVELFAGVRTIPAINMICSLIWDSVWEHMWLNGNVQNTSSNYICWFENVGSEGVAGFNNRWSFITFEQPGGGGIAFLSIVGSTIEHVNGFADDEPPNITQNPLLYFNKSSNNTLGCANNKLYQVHTNYGNATVPEIQIPFNFTQGGFLFEDCVINYLDCPAPVPSMSINCSFANKTTETLPILNLNPANFTVSELVGTDGYNNLISLPYSTSSTPNTVVLRDGYGDGYFTTVGLSALSASGLVATDANKNLTSSISGLSPSLTGLNLSGLTAGQAVVTDGSKNLISLGYTTAATPTTIVERDANGDGYFVTINCSALSTSGLVATDANKNLTSSISSLSPSLTGITLSGALTMNSSVTVGGSGIDGYATTLQITSGTGDALSIAAASSTGTSNGTYIQGGSTTGSSATGGTLFLNGGQSSGTSGIGGNVAINAGAGASGSSSYGHITLSSVDITASTAELLSLNASNQITSSVSGLSPGFTGLTLSGALTMNSSVTVGSSIASTAQITSGSGDALSLFPATSTGTANALYLQGGTTNASSGTGGNLFITAGAASGTTSIGGSVQIVGGSGTSYNGNISFNTVTVLTPGAANGSGNIFIGYNSTNPAHGTTTTSGVMLVVANQTTSSNTYSISSYLPKGGTTPTANTTTGNLTAGWTYLLGPSGVYSVIAQG